MEMGDYLMSVEFQLYKTQEFWKLVLQQCECT
jgi:hypothetical protein